MVPGVSSSRLRPDSDQSRIWCRARPWLVCDSLNELTWVSFVVHWHLTIFFFNQLFSFSSDKDRRTDSRIRRKSTLSELKEKSWLGMIPTRANLRIFFFFFFFCRFVSVVWQDSDRVQSVTQGTWYSGRSSMLSSDSWLIVDIGERSHPNPMHRSSLFQRDFQNRW